MRVVTYSVSWTTTLIILFPIFFGLSYVEPFDACNGYVYAMTRVFAMKDMLVLFCLVIFLFPIDVDSNFSLSYKIDA